MVTFTVFNICLQFAVKKVVENWAAVLNEITVAYGAGARWHEVIWDNTTHVEMQSALVGSASVQAEKLLFSPLKLSFITF